LVSRVGLEPTTP